MVGVRVRSRQGVGSGSGLGYHTGDADVEQRVQTTGPHERRVQQVRPVGGPDHK